MSRAGRLLGAVGVLAVAGGAAAAGTLAPAAPQVAAPPAAVAVPASTTALVCPGAVRLAGEAAAGGEVAYDPQFDPSPAASTVTLAAVATDAADLRLDPLAGDADPASPDDAEPLAGSAVLTRTGTGTPSVVRADPQGDAPAAAAAAVLTATPSGDLRGFAAATCAPAASEAWLVGGSTSLGSSARLVLTNPGATPASVTLELWGPSGAVELAGAPEYLVPPGAERVVLLEGVAAEQRRLVVHLVATGGLVGASLQDSELRGLVPAGVDVVVPGAAPSTRQVVPGLAVVASDPDGSDGPLMRLLAPDGATARLTLLGEAGPVELPGTAELVLAAGEVLDVPLGGLPAGSYTALVESDAPVVAAALLTRGAGAGTSAGLAAGAPLERAWAASVVAGADGPLALPAGAAATLQLSVVPAEAADPAQSEAPAGASDVVVEALDDDGAVVATQEATVPEGSTVALDVGRLASGGAVAAVVVRSDDPRLAWAAVLGATVPDGELVAVLRPAPVAPARSVVDVRLH